MENKIFFYIKHLEQCFVNAENKHSKITNEILCMEGMSGQKTRHFYNNLLNIEDCRYLEIGTWKGSSVCSAMINNNSKITCIDNFSEFADGCNIKETLLNNIDRFKGNNIVSFIEKNCFEVDIMLLPKHNIYLYDGGHTYNEQFKAITHYIDNLDDIFILIIDDWNVSSIRKGTNDAIEKLNLSVIWKKEIILTENDEHTPIEDAKENWWNGISVFLLQKTKNKIFTQDFNTLGLAESLKLFYPIKPTNEFHCIEIGSFEGRGTIVIADHLLSNKSSNIVCVDPFDDVYINGKITIWDKVFQNQYARFINNISFISDKVIIKRNNSNNILPSLNVDYFDFAYIDGDHSSEQVYKDAILTMPLMKKNGIILFDDYLWESEGMSPKNGIDRFIIENQNKVEVILSTYQKAIRIK